MGFWKELRLVVLLGMLRKGVGTTEGVRNPLPPHQQFSEQPEPLRDGVWSFSPGPLTVYI